MPQTHLYAYHDGPRDWLIPESNTVIGCELEVCAPRTDAIPCLLERLPDGWIAERDGSLDPVRGVELVGPPIDVSRDRLGAWRPLLEWLRAEGWRGYHAGSGYGLHVNIARTSGNAVTSHMVTVIHEARRLSRVMARRPMDRWAYPAPKHPCDALTDGTKYRAARVHSDRIEVRIFRSTLAVDVFAACIEYVLAARDYARTLAMPEASDRGWLARYQSAALLSWIADHAVEYPDLVRYLRQRSVLTPTATLQPSSVYAYVPVSRDNEPIREAA